MRTFIRITGAGRIQDPNKADEIIGRGGNYLEGTTRLLGKIEGNGLPPRIQGRKDPYLVFATAPGPASGNDRSELTHGPYLPIDRDVIISYRFRLPKRSPVVEGFTQPLQLWQCAPNGPIAGMRVRSGTSHTVDLVPHGGSRTLIPGEWQRFKLRIDPSRLNLDSCAGTPGADGYRVKFGIYRTSSSTPFEVHFDDLRIRLD